MGYSIDSRMKSRLAVNALDNAVAARAAQGMTVTIPLHLGELETTAHELHTALSKHYLGQKYVRVYEMAENPEILDPQTLNGTNNLELFVYPAADGERVVLAARLDNLGKGASGAAVQNLDLMLERL